MLNDRLVIPRYSDDFNLPKDINTRLIPVRTTEMVWNKETEKYESKTFRTDGLATYNLRFKPGVLEDWYTESPIGKALSQSCTPLKNSTDVITSSVDQAANSLVSSVDKSEDLRNKIIQDTRIIAILRRMKRAIKLGLDYSEDQREVTTIMCSKDIKLFVTGDLTKLIHRINMRCRSRIKVLTSLETAEDTEIVVV